MKENSLKITKKQVWKFIIQILLVAAAGALGGITFKSFFEELNPSIIPTGLSGFAMIINTWMGNILPTSVIYLLLNVIIFGFSLKFFGWKFLVLSGIGMGTYVLGMQFGYIPEIITSVDGDRMLLCIVGSIIMGAMTGISIRMGGSTGGSDILGKLLNRAMPKIKTGWCILFINVIVLTLSIITSGLQTGLYALINSIVSSIATDMVLDNSKKIVAYYIICDKPNEISAAILSNYHRGVTRVDGTGMFTGNDKAVLLCLVPYDQSYKMREFVLGIDEKAFVFSTPVTQTIGEHNLMSAPLSKAAIQEKTKSVEIEATQEKQPTEIKPTTMKTTTVKSNTKKAPAKQASTSTAKKTTKQKNAE